MYLINRFDRTYPGFGSDPPTGLGQARGSCTLVVSEYLGPSSNPPIGSDWKWVLHASYYLVSLFSAIQRSCLIGAIKWTPFSATSYFVLYCTYGYLLYRVPVIHFQWFF